MNILAASDLRCAPLEVVMAGSSSIHSFARVQVGRVHAGPCFVAIEAEVDPKKIKRKMPGLPSWPPHWSEKLKDASFVRGYYKMNCTRFDHQAS